MGKYGCRKVRVYPAECSEQLGRDPSKNGRLQIPIFEEFFWGGNTLGLVPSSHSHSLGYACTLYAPTSPLKNRACLRDRTKVRERESPKRRFSAENRRFLQTHPFSWKFKHVETAGNRRLPQKTAGNRRLGSVTLGPSPLARPQMNLVEL